MVITFLSFSNLNQKHSILFKWVHFLGTDLEPVVSENGFPDIQLPSSTTTDQEHYCPSNSGINLDEQSVGSFQVGILLIKNKTTFF